VTIAVVLTTEVLTSVVVAVLPVVTAAVSDELVEVMLELVVLVTADVVDVLLVVGAVVVVVYTVGGLGGSRWKIPDRELATGLLPTAKPSSGEVR
jgi:hypothetical protein